MYELFFKNYYQYIKYEEAIAGEEYYKTIYFMKEDILKAYELWNKHKKNSIAELKPNMPRELKNDLFEL